MCSSYDFIEQQALDMSEAIRKNSLFKVVRVEFSGGGSLEIQRDMIIQNVSDFITKVILEDQEGKLYAIEPSPIGLRFAKGEISFSEYQRLTKRETLSVVGSFSIITGIFGLFAFSMMKFLL